MSSYLLWQTDGKPAGRPTVLGARKVPVASWELISTLFATVNRVLDAQLLSFRGLEFPRALAICERLRVKRRDLDACM